MYSVGVDNIRGFVIKHCTDILVPALKRIFNLSLSQQYFPTLWKQEAIVPVLTKATLHLLAITDRHLFFIILSKLSEFVIHDHISH
jgi:hypothetical protein